MYDTKYNVTFELGRGDYCIVRPRYHKWINVVTYDRGMHEMAWGPHTSSPRRDCEMRFFHSSGHWPKYWHAPCILRAATEPCGFILTRKSYLVIFFTFYKVLPCKNFKDFFLSKFIFHTWWWSVMKKIRVGCGVVGLGVCCEQFGMSMNLLV